MTISAPVVRACLSYGGWLWLGTRTILLPIILYYEGPRAAWEFLAGGPMAAPLVLPIAVVLGLIDSHRRGQLMLLANLGVPGSVLGAVIAVAGLAGELVLWAVTGAAAGLA